MTIDSTKQSVKDYYGKVLSNSEDLKTSACCISEGIPRKHREILKKIEPEILEKFYGCGSPLPPALEGCTVLDLGCGTGRDVYLASALVGENGKVIGVDMTDEQIDVAKKHEESQMKKFGYERNNVVFKKGFIEDLGSLGIEDNSVDVVISNCVINLSPEKKNVFAEIFRVLKPGGELFFSDVFADRRMPEHIKKDPIFYGECLGGAMYVEDFRRMLGEVGCLDSRIVKQRKMSIDNEEMSKLAGDIVFYSLTIRAFKLECEDAREDYGQVAIYLGNIEGNEDKFSLDQECILESKVPTLICGNTALMLEETRYAKYFKVSGDRNVHNGVFGLYDNKQDESSESSGSCC